jgi:hypothetical protein
MNLARRRLSTMTALSALALLAACGSKSTPPVDETSGDDTVGTGGDTGAGGGTAGGGGSATGGTKADGGKGGTAGTAGNGGAGGAAGSNPGSGGGAGAPPPPPPYDGGAVVLVPPTSTCPKLVFEASKTVTQTIGTSTATDVFTWQDSQCQPRTAAMARDNRGYLRQTTYQVDGTTRTVTGTGVNGWNGFGFIVNHGMSNGAGTPGPTGYSALYVGDHHAIYQYQSNVGTSIPVTRQWLIATGRDHPLFAVTFDTSGRTPPVGADTRTPYGDMAFDGDENFSSSVIDGVGWGEHYKFVTTKAPLTLNSTWDYSQKNLVPYCMEWRNSPDAEMGLVQSQTYLQHDAGGYWEYSSWGKNSSTQVLAKDSTTGAVVQMGLMPISWNWPYQLNQYELCYPNADTCLDNTTGSHRIAWGTNYGAVGGAVAAGTYPALGDAKQLQAQPGQSYSVFVVLGKHSTNVVLQQMHEVEVVQGTAITATVGTVVTSGPAGVGRTDTITYQPAGYDPIYSTWNITAAANKAAFSVTVASDAIADPIVVIQGFTGAAVPAITVDGVAATADKDFFASLDATGQKLWITFRPGWSGTHQITVG